MSDHFSRKPQVKKKKFSVKLNIDTCQFSFRLPTRVRDLLEVITVFKNKRTPSDLVRGWIEDNAEKITNDGRFIKWLREEWPALRKELFPTFEEQETKSKPIK